MVFVGEEVVLQGTGRRWAGMHFTAIVMDIRESDGTIKVRFSSDGGFKRFSKDEFSSLVVKDSSPYKFDAYELVSDHYDPSMDHMSSASAIREELYEAVKQQDFKRAGELKSLLKDTFAAVEKVSDAKARLVVAVQNEDFDQAYHIKMEIEALNDLEKKQAIGDVDFSEVLAKAQKRALGGGLAGALAMFLQVTTLMWMRTTMNYQYRYGTTTREAITKLYAEGGVRRFYKGIAPALFQGPLSRFGDTAANTGVLTLMNGLPSTADLPVGVKTVCASGAAATWRIFLMPIDTLKTNLQVEGSLTPLRNKFKANGPFVFYHGALAACSATFAGHLPWFGTYNFLNSKIPEYEGKVATLGRNAVMGFCASVVSDTTSNSIRVVKTYRQTSQEAITYLQCAKNIIATDGLAGLFGRGLQTRILANGAQGVMFSVLWKYFDKYVFNSV